MENEITTMVTEVCAECERENTFVWDPGVDGYTTFCPACGKKMMLCDACRHSDDNECGFCDWSKENGCWRELEDKYAAVLKAKTKYEELSKKNS